MKTVFYVSVLIAALSLCNTTSAATSELDLIRDQFEQLRREYEARLANLEDRLAQAEDHARESRELNEALSDTVDELTLAPESGRTASRPSDFNPEIGVVMVGTAQRFNPSPGEFEIPGFSLGEETGYGDEGFSIGESDFTLGGNIDDKFYASMTLAVTKDEGVVLEEGYVQTLSLGNGLNIRAGRFFSSIGYLNENHLHTDNFSGRPLPYKAMLGNQYGDDGVRVSWLVPTDIYWTIDAEGFRGDEFPSGGAANHGLGSWALSSHWGGDVGVSHSWQAGVSALFMDVDERVTGEDKNEIFTGDSELIIADFVYKWAPFGSTAQQAVTLQGEYFWRNEDGQFSALDVNDLNYDSDQTGWYLDGIYQFMPRWRLGLRHSQVSAGKLGTEFSGTTLDDQNHKSRESTVMLDWTNSEFSRIRLQYSRDESTSEKMDIWTLQYIMSLGAHAAHSY